MKLSFEGIQITIYPRLDPKAKKALSALQTLKYWWFGIFGTKYWAVWCPTKEMYLCSCKKRAKHAGYKVTFCLDPNKIDQNFLRKGKKGIENMMRRRSGADRWRRCA